MLKRPVVVVRRSTERPEAEGTFSVRAEPGGRRDTLLRQRTGSIGERLRGLRRSPRPTGTERRRGGCSPRWRRCCMPVPCRPSWTASEVRRSPTVAHDLRLYGPCFPPCAETGNALFRQCRPVILRVREFREDSTNRLAVAHSTGQEGSFP
ncbi:hypothetical protein [Amycolatopsis cihanbeyliensis]